MTNVSIASDLCFPSNPSSLFAGYKTDFHTLCISYIISLPVNAQNAEEAEPVKKHPCKLTNINKILQNLQYIIQGNRVFFCKLLSQYSIACKH